jgi:hypothetical protein
MDGEVGGVFEQEATRAKTLACTTTVDAVRKCRLMDTNVGGLSTDIRQLTTAMVVVPLMIATARAWFGGDDDQLIGGEGR